MAEVRRSRLSVSVRAPFFLLSRPDRRRAPRGSIARRERLLARLVHARVCRKLGELLDEQSAKGGKIIGRSTRDEMLVAMYRPLGVDASSGFESAAKLGRNGECASAHHVRRDEQRAG